MFISTAPAKIILFGEHSVVYDKIGVAGAVNLHSTAEIKESKTPKLVLKDMGIEEEFTFEEVIDMKKEADELISQKKYRELKEKFENPSSMTKLVIAKTLEGIKEKKPFEVKIYSEIPRGGFGSSSSVFSATSAAIEHFLTGKIDKKKISESANYGDISAHGGTPSGIDASTITYGGYVKYKKTEGITPLEIKTKLPLVIGNTGIPAKTSETVTRVREKREQEPEKINKILDEMDEIARRALVEIEKNNLKEIGKLMNENQERLRQLEVSHEKLEELINASLKAGALGAR